MTLTIYASMYLGQVGILLRVYGSFFLSKIVVDIIMTNFESSSMVTSRKNSFILVQIWQLDSESENCHILSTTAIYCIV